ncbi:hypothetical protein CLS_37960 [[Clostridium] cf. saccharolyticum K10]|nr:hypothetical protein CLS_37960 [[Clostridium] cf. saccharolyticum K10]
MVRLSGLSPARQDRAFFFLNFIREKAKNQAAFHLLFL